MSQEEQIRKRLAEMAKEHGPVQTVLAKVISVDENELTCVLDDEDIVLNDVRLVPVINGKESDLIIPKVDSWVLATRIENDAEWMVIAADEVAKKRITVNNLVFEMDGNKFDIKKGNESLGKCIDDLVLQIQQIYAPKNTAAITAIQTRFKSFLNGA